MTVYNLDDRKFYDVKDWIRRVRKKHDWDWIYGKSSERGWFKRKMDEDDWPENIEECWKELVHHMKEMEDNKIRLEEDTNRSTISDSNNKGDFETPMESSSCWQLYYRSLIEKGYDNADRIEVECRKILNFMSADTSESGPVKGLVAGYVQSGKTANIAGLIAMAADYGWNLFIVLSGTIESLRVQNRDRLFDDLNKEGGYCRWNRYDVIKPKSPEQNPSKLRFDNNQDKHLVVCLKNKKRLSDLIRWLNLDQNKKKQMKVLLIDDEADLASINTAPVGEGRKTINRLIINLVDGRDVSGKERGPYACMNYVSYTATPYANFLSEGYPESLYPKDFIVLLTPSARYRGPKEVFGESGFGVIGLSQGQEFGTVDVTENTEDAMKPVVEKSCKAISPGLRDAVNWFLCCVAVRRRGGHHEPVSMLIHISATVEPHRLVAEIVTDYLENVERNDILNGCRRVYEEKTEEFPLKIFLQCCNEYPNAEEIKDYPKFDEIKDHIIDCLENEIRHIGLDKETEERVYGRGIHICIDNSSGDVIREPEDDEKLIPRLVYPTREELDSMDPAPAFIVVGGNTLSRGLTIKGLVSTYFARRIDIGDTLMQMGRWFGYCIGYELLPRIWMSSDSYESFLRLIDVDESLREFIRQHYSVVTPSDYPPLVKMFPKTGHLKRMTSASKSRGAVETRYNFRGTLFETTTFDTNPKKLNENLNRTSEFLRGLGEFKQSQISSCLVWRKIQSDVVTEYLSELHIHPKIRGFDEVERMNEWIKANCSSGWNIILAGVERDKAGIWDLGNGILINKVERSAKQRIKDSDTGFDVIYTKELSSPRDRFADVEIDKLSVDQREKFERLKRNPDSEWRTIRYECNLEDTPAIIIYCIFAGSSAGEGRYELGVDTDIIGVSVIMPGLNKAELKGQYYQLRAGRG